MMPPDDWRRMDQESYLSGKAMRSGPWQEPSPGADHDHCSFCFLKVTEGDPGYITDDDRCDWVCPECFDDFKVEFGWTVVGR
jgi:hypothetical protein